MFIFQLPEYLSRPLSFSAAKTKRLELTGNLSRFSLFSFTQFHCSLPPLTQTPTAAFHQTFFFCYFTFFSLSLFIPQKYSVGLARALPCDFLQVVCVDVPLCGASWASLEKKKMVRQSSTAHSVPNQSAASSRSLSRASRLRAHLHLSLMTQTLFRWHHAEYKMSI